MPPPPANVLKAFDFAQETTKQLITLATGIIALSITFLHDIVGSDPHHARIWAEVSWFVFLASIIFGIGTLMSLSGDLEKKPNPSIYDPNIVLFAGTQIVTFFAAIVLTIIFGIKAG